MDRRFEKTLVAALATVALTTTLGAWAQDETATEGTAVFGNQELPKGLTIVPWKKSEPGELSDGPTRLVDEPLEAIDPEVFQRRIEFYQSSRGAK